MGVFFTYLRTNLLSLKGLDLCSYLDAGRLALITPDFSRRHGASPSNTAVAGAGAPLMRVAPTAGHAARGTGDRSRGIVLRGIVLGLVLLAAWQLRQLQQLQRLEQQQRQLQLQPSAAAAAAAAAVLQPRQPASGQAESRVLSVEQLPHGLPGGPKVRVRVRVRVRLGLGSGSRLGLGSGSRLGGQIG